MIRRSALLALPFLLLAAKDEAPIDPGPQPEFSQAIAMATEAVKARLIDPMSAQIEWPYAFTGGTLKAFLSRKQAGWYTCGYVNSKNRMGGYTGRSPVLVLIRNGAIVELGIGETGAFDSATLTCLSLVSKGLLSPSPAAAAPPSFTETAASDAASAAQRGGLGVSFLPSPFGAMIAAVAPASLADKAGLKPGETIESLNGVSLKGMDQAAMIAVLHGATGAVTLGIVGVGPVKVR